MRQIDEMSSEEIDVLKLKGMLECDHERIEDARINARLDAQAEHEDRDDGRSDGYGESYADRHL